MEKTHTTLSFKEFIEDPVLFLDYLQETGIKDKDMDNLLFASTEFRGRDLPAFCILSIDVRPDHKRYVSVIFTQKDITYEMSESFSDYIPTYWKVSTWELENFTMFLKEIISFLDKGYLGLDTHQGIQVCSLLPTEKVIAMNTGKHGSLKEAFPKVDFGF